MKSLILAAAFGLILADPAAARAEPPPAPYTVLMESDPGLATHTIYRPSDLRAMGKTRLPIVAWANGGCANRGDSFANFLTEVAGHGFLVVAIGPIAGPQPARSPRPTGDASRPRDLNAPAETLPSQLTDAIDWAVAENARSASPYYRRLDVKKVAIMGQSCGGLQAIAASGDPRVTTTVVWNSGVLNVGGGLPAARVTKESLKALHAPVAYISGDATDVAFVNANDDFARLTGVAAFRGYEDGVGHLGTYFEPRGGEFAQLAVAWLDWQLRGDRHAKKMFVGPRCGLCLNPKWHVTAKGMTR